MDLGLVLPAAIVAFVLGAAIGSFLNVVVYRVPAGLSLLWPPSRCPQCLHSLKKRENVPVLGWLWLKGRCAHCRSPISIRYPLVEAATALMFVLVFFVCGWSSLTWGYWLFFSWLLALSLIDADTMTLPNALTQTGLVAGLLFQGVVGWQLGGGNSPLDTAGDDRDFRGSGGHLGIGYHFLRRFDGIGASGNGGGGRQTDVRHWGLVGVEVDVAWRISRLCAGGFCRRGGDRFRMVTPTPTHAIRSVFGVGSGDRGAVGRNDFVGLPPIVFSCGVA